jgi:hypothetical protein
MSSNGIQALKPTHALILPLVLLLLACGGCMSVPPGGSAGEPGRAPFPGAPVTGPLHPAGVSASGPPSVYIISPEFDGGIAAGNVTVTVLVRNFSLVQGTGRSVAAGEGRIMCFFDVPPATDPGSPAETRPGTFQVADRARCTWYNVSPGMHTFSAELVNNDNTPLVPAVLDAVDVTAVAENGCALPWKSACRQP